jgi:hypothetical protein
MKMAHSPVVLDLATFQNLPLQGGFLQVEVQLAAQSLGDPIERAATTLTMVRGYRFHVLLRADLDERELSISLSHEALEAATVAALTPPIAVMELNEGDFERIAQDAHSRLGVASPRTLNLLLAEHGF